jgi:hypothetical protein
MAVGAPVKIPVSSGAIIVLYSTNTKTTIGSATFSYKVVGV